MSVGCCIVASDTQPLHEAIRHNETGHLVDFFNKQQLADNVCELLDLPDERARLGKNAREFARATYDLKTICLPRQLAWVESLVNKG
jgi:glycosyltransferase involved in cell wall biosynthesis